MPKAKRPKWAEKDTFCVTKVTKDNLLAFCRNSCIDQSRENTTPGQAPAGSTHKGPTRYHFLHTLSQITSLLLDKSCPLHDVLLINAWRPMHRLRSVLKSIPNHFRYQNMPYYKAEKIAISAQIFNIHSQKKLHPCKLKSHTEAMN